MLKLIKFLVQEDKKIVIAWRLVKMDSYIHGEQDIKEN
jgi:hypothetical protein